VLVIGKKETGGFESSKNPILKKYRKKPEIP